MTWEGVSVGEKAFAYFLFTVFEIILIAGVVGWCLGWSDKTAPSDPDPNSITYTQMLKNLVNPPPPLPKTAEELEHEERIKALVPGERRAAVDAADVSCFGGSSASKGKAMELYKKPSRMEPAAAAAAPPPPPRVKVAKGPGSEGSDKSSSSAGSGGKNAIHKSKSGAKKAQEGGDKDKAPSSGAGKRPPPPKKTAAARKEEVELV